MRAAKLHSPSLQKVLQPVGRETQGCGVGALAAIASVELAPKNLVDPHFGFGKIGLALCCADIVHDSKRRASGGCVGSPDSRNARTPVSAAPI